MKQVYRDSSLVPIVNEDVREDDGDYLNDDNGVDDHEHLCLSK